MSGTDAFLLEGAMRAIADGMPWRDLEDPRHIAKAILRDEPYVGPPMDYGWNEPAPASTGEFVELLEDIAAAVRAGDSLEGFIQYTPPIGDPWEEERAQKDPRWAAADFGVIARYRIGNQMGQGGLAVFTKPRELDAGGER